MQEHDETDELLLMDEDVLLMDPEHLPRQLLSDFAVYNSEVGTWLLLQFALYYCCQLLLFLGFFQGLACNLVCPGALNERLRLLGENSCMITFSNNMLISAAICLYSPTP